MGCTASSAICPSADADQVLRKGTESSTTFAHCRSNMEYKIGMKIGKGSYAQVHCAIRKQTKADVAVKIRNFRINPTMKPEESREKTMKSLVHELDLWNAVGTHENCVQLLDSFFDDHLAYMVMERCDSSLYKYLRRQEEVYETCLGSVFEQILTGISHMHTVSVIHRDLKPDNFLVRGHTVKICDFGLSAMIPSTDCLDGIVGTAPYMPPEMLAIQGYDQKADVWSFGVVAYLLLCGEFPYRTTDGSAKMMKKSILNGAAVDCRKVWLTANAISFLQQVLRRSPKKRPTAALALQLPFLTEPDISCLPSLRGVLIDAERTGAFDSKDLACATDTDITLEKLSNGELEYTPIQRFADLNAKNENTKAKSVKQRDEGLHNSRPPRSESTSCGSSSAVSETSKSSFESRQKQKI